MQSPKSIKALGCGVVVFAATFVSSGIIFTILNQLIEPPFKMAVGAAVLLAGLIGFFRPLQYRMFRYRATYLGALLASPVLFAGSGADRATSFGPMQDDRTLEISSNASSEGKQKLDRNNIRFEAFYLPSGYEKYRDILKEGAMRVMEQSGCDAVDYADVSINKGTKTNPVFYYTCVKGGMPTNIFVSKSDLEKKQFTVAQPISENTGRVHCEAYAKAQLNFPSTFDSGLFDWATQEWPNGRRRIVMKFTAKNAFGLELPAEIDCLFIPKEDGGYSMEADIVRR